MIDGDMDASNKECEMVHVRILQNEKPTNKLVGQLELQHGHALGEQPTITVFLTYADLINASYPSHSKSITSHQDCF